MKTLITGIFITAISLGTFASQSNEGLDPTKRLFKKWSKSFVAYPEEASVESEQGLVYVSFEISQEGEMKNVNVDSNLSELLEAKAVELVEAMPKGHLYENGFIEGTRFVLPVKFNID